MRWEPSRFTVMQLAKKLVNGHKPVKMQSVIRGEACSERL